MVWLICSQISQTCCPLWINRTNDDDMTGVKTRTKKALHHLAGHRLVSIQEAVHMVDDQELVICSDRMTYVNISQGQVLRDDLETDKRKDIITVYRNRSKNTTTYLWNNSFIVCLATTHSNKPRRMSSMKTQTRMLSQATSIVSWYLRVWIAHQSTPLIFRMHEGC